MTTEISLPITAAATTTRDPRWEEQANCRSVDPELFFPDSKQQSAEAVAVCKVCPVRERCLAQALDQGDMHFGVLGGLTPRERRALLHGTRPARKAGEALAICRAARDDILQWREAEVPLGQIAKRLDVSARTVRNALEKFELESQLEQQDMEAVA